MTFSYILPNVFMKMKSFAILVFTAPVADVENRHRDPGHVQTCRHPSLRVRCVLFDVSRCPFSPCETGELPTRSGAPPGPRLEVKGHKRTDAQN